MEEQSEANNENVCNELSATLFRLIGILQTTGQIFKRGHRNNLLPFVNTMITPCLRLFLQDNQTLIRKLGVKTIQRLGMTLLPPTIPKWRYQRGSRSLLINLQSSKTNDKSMGNISNEEKPVENTTNNKTINNIVDDNDDEDNIEIPDIIEEIVDQLLQSLRDKDTVVRWSAAKGLGRIAMRLPKLFVDDMVGASLELFNDPEEETAWHGACLSLAELCRRGLLLPDRLGDVMPIISKAIHFDILRGQHSIGSPVRDAACYVCWAFARAYSPLILKPYVKDLSNAMLLATLFDREINCRRAASAAFQENVGRQGNENFPLGIDIITLADYFSLSSRINAYTHVAPAVAALDDSLHEAIEIHLREKKLIHWDEDIRILASKALGKLVAMNPSRLIKSLELLKLAKNLICKFSWKGMGDVKLVLYTPLSQ